MRFYDTWASGYLDTTGWALYETAMKFFGWSDATKDHWIGKIIIYPFTEFVGDRFEASALAVWRVSDKLASVNAFIQDLMAGWLLSELLAGLVRDWNTFRHDPMRWVFYRVVDFWPDFYWFAQDPAYMLSYWLGAAWGELQEIASNRVAWVLRQIEQAWPDFYWFRQNPTWTVRCWLVSQWPKLEGLFTSTEDWLKFRLSDIWRVDYTFWYDPIGNLRALLAFDLQKVIRDQRAALYATSEHLLRYFIEGVW